MSIFSHIRRSRQRAKEHNAKVAEQKKMEAESIPYRHVPTHAATDAIAGAPPSWREADRPKIKEQNRRRSAMAAHGHNMNMPAVPRVGSSLSHVSYPSNDATPVVPPIPRTYSYNGYPSGGRQVIYSVPDVAFSQPSSIKGKEVERMAYFSSPSISPSPSKGVPLPKESSPVGSSSHSNSSQEVLEMRSLQRPHTSHGQPSTSAASSERTHRLHPSRRRLSDASIEKASASISRNSTARDSRPPPSMRGFNSIPPVPAIPTDKIVHVRSSSVGSIVSSTGHTTGTSTPRAKSRHNSMSSVQGFALSPIKLNATKLSTPRTSTTTYIDLPTPPPSSTLPSFDFDFGDSFTNGSSTPSEPRGRDRQPRTTRFTELENYEPKMESTSNLSNHSSVGTLGRSPARPLAPQHIVHVFPEAIPIPTPTPAPTPTKSKSNRLSKVGSKLRKSRPSAV